MGQCLDRLVMCSYQGSLGHENCMCQAAGRRVRHVAGLRMEEGALQGPGSVSWGGPGEKGAV